MNILERVPRDAKLRAIVRRSTFGKRVFCPRCGSSHIRRSEHRYTCPRCRKPFSLTSASWLHGTKLGFKTIWLLVDCWQRRIAFKTTADIAGVSCITVRRWFRRFQTYLVYESPSLEGTIEMDESFLGRKKHKNQRIVLGAYERGSKRIVLRMTTNREQGTTDRFLLRHVSTKSMVWTDSASCYDGINRFFGYLHGTCNHGGGHFGPTNHIENVWSVFKTFIRRTYHHFHKEWLPMLLREFEARWNTPTMFFSPLFYLRTSLTAVPSG